MKFEDFLTPEQLKEQTPVEDETAEEETVDNEEEAVVDENVELDVQKAVVESLAAEKAEQDEHIVDLRKRIIALTSKVALLENQLALKTEEIQKNSERLIKNEEKAQSNQVALLDRSVIINDKFEGESRDQLLEVIKEARDIAEKDGRLRRAQILESILVANEPLGILAAKRTELEKLFSDNQNIVNGTVINSLDKMNIPYKCGETYLLPSEIIKRTY